MDMCYYIHVSGFFMFYVNVYYIISGTRIYICTTLSATFELEYNCISVYFLKNWSMDVPK